MEGIGAAAQDYRSVPQMPRCTSWWLDDQRNGEPCALKGASTVRGDALGRPRKWRVAPTLPRLLPGVSVGLSQGRESAVTGRVAPVSPGRVSCRETGCPSGSSKLGDDII